MAISDSEYFRDLPPLLAERLAEASPGQELSLFLLEYVPSGKGVIFPVQYIHREMIYRTEGMKDAVALGSARLEHDREFIDARILFSRPNQTATLRGLVLEGQVKTARWPVRS